jgi:hypothetical protein
MASYIADPCPEPSMSKGVVKTLFEKTPLHAHHEHPRLGGNNGESSSRADKGSSAHQYALGGESRIHFVEALNKDGEQVADWRTKAAKEERDEARADGKIPMLQKDRQKLEDMGGKAREFIAANFGEVDTEQTAIVKRNGVWLRCRPDIVKKGAELWVDYKTVTNADQAAWVKSTMFSAGYDIQGTNYAIAAQELAGIVSPIILFMLQELEPPFAISVVGLDEPAIELAARKIDAVSPVWRRCLDSDTWPGYSPKPYWAMPPTYVEWDVEQREAMQGALK